MATISGWGRFPIAETNEIVASTMRDAQRATAREDGLVARGNGRAYGDAAIGIRNTLNCTMLNRMRAFDPATGRLTVEAGVLLEDIIAAFTPRGFFPAVVPGTRFVTVGGAIAADVHGKNHHRDGGFGAHVDSLTLATADGQVLQLSNDQHPDLFAATIGGMGLTGTILEATLQLQRIETGWIRQRIVVANDLAASLAALDGGDDATYSVAWIDCVGRGARLGRSLIFLGEHARLEELTPAAAQTPFPISGPPRLRVPLDLPAATLNRWSIGAFNELYFRQGARKAEASGLAPAMPYFFPLDGVGDWNRIYGRRGFVQHQCVLPPEQAPEVLAEMLGRIVARGDASFLAVLKKLGPAKGLLSFPFAGYTLALDFPLSDGLLPFLDELDRLVVRAGGRLYLAKDARQSRATFEAGYANLAQFRAIRHSIDPATRLRSRLSERLGL
jgi:decaprenylphospho-beta-D-ribofuranose 2-oxidase